MSDKPLPKHHFCPFSTMILKSLNRHATHLNIALNITSILGNFFSREDILEVSDPGWPKHFSTSVKKSVTLCQMYVESFCK